MDRPLLTPCTTREINRRSYLRESAYGIGSLALAHLLGSHSAAGSTAPLASSQGGVLVSPHRTPHPTGDPSLHGGRPLAPGELR